MIPENKSVYLDAFIGLDSDILKEMKLDVHIAKGGTEKDNGLIVASVIKVSFHKSEQQTFSRS